MGVLENSHCVLFGLTNWKVMFTRVVLQKSATKSVKTSSTKAGRRWGHGLSLLNPLQILLDPFDVFGTAIADGMAELYGCPLLDGKHCIALSFRYEIKRMNSLEGNKIQRQKTIPMPRPNAVRLKVNETKVHWQSRVTVDVSFFFLSATPKKQNFWRRTT